MQGQKQDEVRVRLLQGDGSSGLSLMTMQYLEQLLGDAPAKRQQARNLRGRLALEATDAEVAITVSFWGNEIDIQDGVQPPLDAYIGGPLAALTDLLAGRANPLVEHLHGRLRVRSSLRHPFLPYRVYNLLKLSPAAAQAGASRWLWLAGIGAGLLVGIALALILRRSLTGGGR